MPCRAREPRPRARPGENPYKRAATSDVRSRANAVGEMSTLQSTVVLQGGQPAAAAAAAAARGLQIHRCDSPMAGATP